MKAHLYDSQRELIHPPTSEHAFLNDTPYMLRQSKRPVEEVKLLIGAMKKIARYLDGLEDSTALYKAEMAVHEICFEAEGKLR